jgi:cysteine synthase
MRALVVNGLPNIKAVPSFGMLFDDYRAGYYRGKHTIIVPSSGNTAYAIARLAPAFGFKKVKIILPADVPPMKRGVLAALSSVEIIETPGSTTERAEEESRLPGHYYLDQYNHESNRKYHRLYTGPEVLRAMGGKADIVAIALGSAGTAMGIAQFLNADAHVKKTAIVGVRPALGQQSPGTRDGKKMQIVKLDWRKWVDAVIEEGGRKESFVGMRRLWSQVEPLPGPSSGLAYDGLVRYLGRLSPEERRGRSAAFVCPDGGLLYPDYTTGELDTHEGMV